MTPITYYKQKIAEGKIFADPEQTLVMEKLEAIYQQLNVEHDKRVSLLHYFRKPGLVHGLYVWGGVGIGKTFMMDCFFHALPFPQKLRLHFHQFMQRVHLQLTKHQGEQDPLKQIAQELARDIIVLCFDEFFVSDITDAMLLGRLLKALFAEGVCLVTTSNVAPDDLYKNGLQRSQFLPAIALLKAQTDIMHMPTKVDYRLRHLQEAGVFYTPLTADNAQKMEKTFTALTQAQQITQAPLEINGRLIPVIKRSDDVVWFEFTAICTVPRSQNDYLAIASLYKNIFISNIPAIDANEKDMICLFISMVDVFYDARTRLVLSAAEPVEQLYSRGFMVMAYSRTQSRLLEMQSQDYFNDN